MMTNKEYFDKLFSVVGYDSFGIHKYGQLHEIADVMGWDEINRGSHLRELWTKVCYYTRKLIRAGYPIEEYKIKCCSWSSKETWHPIFYIKKEGEIHE